MFFLGTGFANEREATKLYGRPGVLRVPMVGCRWFAKSVPVKDSRLKNADFDGQVGPRWAENGCKIGCGVLRECDGERETVEHPEGRVSGPIFEGFGADFAKIP